MEYVPGKTLEHLIPRKGLRLGNTLRICRTDCRRARCRSLRRYRSNLVYYYSEEDHFRCLYARRLNPATKKPLGDAFAVRHFHGDQRPADGTATGYGLTTDRLYLPMVNQKGNIWLAEPETSR